MAARTARRATLAAGAAAAFGLVLLLAGTVQAAGTTAASAAAPTSASTSAPSTGANAAASAAPARPGAAPAAAPAALPPMLRIGFRTNAVPFSYQLPGQDRPVGYAIELCERAIAEWQQAAGGPAPRLEYVPVDSRQRFSALKDRSIDLECANTTVTRGRRQDGFVFSLPYFITGSRVLARGFEVQQLKDLGGHAVALAAGTTTAAAVRANFSASVAAIRYLPVTNRQQAFELLESGRADAFVEDDTVLHGLRARLRSPEAWRITGPYLSVEPFAVMFSAARDDQRELRAAVDRSLRRQMRSGELAALHRRWFEQAIPPRGEALGIGMGPLMRDFIRHPTGTVDAYP
jgi:glutamate/aspartate transport system substrate-binding protein